jgi:Kef-type K+ transport system membrane component KefB
MGPGPQSPATGKQMVLRRSIATSFRDPPQRSSTDRRGETFVSRAPRAAPSEYPQHCAFPLSLARDKMTTGHAQWSGWVATVDLLFQLALVLIGARIGAELVARVAIPRIIGELFAGIVLGPTLLGWVTANEVIKLLAEIGIILLLFEVGLETDLTRLMRTGTRSLRVAIGGFITPLVLGTAVSLWLFDLPLLVALFVGGTLTATSIGITVRTLSDLGRHNSREGQIVLGAAVADDVMGVLLLAVLYDFSRTGELSFSHAGELLFFVGVFLLLAPVVAKLLSVLIKRFHATSLSPGIIPVTLVSLVLLFAAAAHWFRAPELLGGFVAGIALSRRFFLPFGAGLRADPQFTEQIRREISPIIQLITPIFFVTVGLSLDLRAVDWSSLFVWLFSFTILVVAVGGKLFGAWLIDEPLHSRLAIGMAMVPRGEVGLIFAELGRLAGVFDQAVYAALIIVITYTTLLTPFFLKEFYRRYST